MGNKQYYESPACDLVLINVEHGIMGPSITDPDYTNGGSLDFDDYENS